MAGPPAHLISVVELIPESYVACLDLEAIFGRRAPLEVDLGCGDGSFLTALAKQRPEHNFLGIERLVGRVRSATHKARILENVRVLRMETSYAVRYLLPAGSVQTFHLLFPDPWPKRRHQRRRVVTSDFLSAIVAALASNGTLRVVTDQFDYFEQIRSLAQELSDLRVAGSNVENEFPDSAFERKFKRAGAAIHRLELRKTSPVT
jgi:tRNA (guanine-N7-)-methyltransferase